MQDYIETSAEFPAVTICNLDPLTSLASIQFYNSITRPSSSPIGVQINNTGQANNLNKSMLNNPPSQSSQVSPIGVLTEYAGRQMVSLISYTTQINNLNVKMLNNLRNPINETVLVCIYNSQPCDRVSIEFVKHTLFPICIKVVYYLNYIYKHTLFPIIIIFYIYSDNCKR